MTPTIILTIIAIYFGTLFLISFFVSKNNHNNEAFFKANKNAKWYLVAFGMIGTALSGVTFISVPGEVGAASGEQFKYFQFVLGNTLGFIVVAKVLLPLYYKLHLTSIYTYIEQRLGKIAYKTAATIFLISRSIGSAFRLYLVIIVLQKYVFDSFQIPFFITTLAALALIFSYTYKGGLKTIIITDSLQTFFLVSSVFLTIYFICQKLNLDTLQTFETIKNSSYSKIFFFDNFFESKFHFIKQFLGGFFVTIAMVGLDQDLMQKNLSCKNINEAQKNMLSFTFIFLIINLFFLSVGALLYIYANQNHIQIPLDTLTQKPRTDLLFPEIAFHHLSIIPAIVFLLGITAATFATTDSAITALTTSFCIDFLNLEKQNNLTQNKQTKIRHWVHLGFSAFIFFIILIFQAINDNSVVSMIFKVASYTYGPLLGLFAFGILTKKEIKNSYFIPFICFLSPILTLLTNHFASYINYIFDNELIIFNALYTFIGLYLLSIINGRAACGQKQHTA